MDWAPALSIMLRLC
ncbi:unnamed protein product [Rhodiola kirilowii]